MKDWKFYARYIKNERPHFRLGRKNDYVPKGKKDIKRRAEVVKKANDFEKKWDFRYEETWNLDIEIAKYILPRLAYLRDHTHGYPDGLTFKEWRRILNKMCKGFYLISQERFMNNFNDEEQKIIGEALELFAVYYFHLWD